MSLDRLIREATAELHDRTPVDLTTGVAEVRRMHGSRAAARSAARGVALLVAVIVTVATWSALRRDTAPDPVEPTPEVSNGAVVSRAAAPASGLVVVSGRLTHLPDDDAADVSFTADGTGLVYTTNGGRVVLFDVASGERRVLASCPQMACLAGLSRDQERLAVARSRAIEIRDLDTGAASRVGTAGVDPGRPVWSPDGSRIAFAAPSGVYVAQADGSGVTRIHRSSDRRSAAITPSWSPDGSALAVVDGRPVPASDNGAPVVETTYTVLNVDLHSGTTTRVAVAGTCFCVGLAPPAVAWSPDGSRIAFVRVGARSRAFTVRPDGTDVRRLASAKVSGTLAWQPVLR